jgi:hypothetical protein
MALASRLGESQALEPNEGNVPTPRDCRQIKVVFRGIFEMLWEPPHCRFGLIGDETRTVGLCGTPFSIQLIEAHWVVHQLPCAFPI